MPPVLIFVVCFAPSDIQGQIGGNALLLSTTLLMCQGKQWAVCDWWAIHHLFTWMQKEVHFMSLISSHSERRKQIPYKSVYRSLQIMSRFSLLVTFVFLA